MSVAVVMPEPTPIKRVLPRKYYCCGCGRFLGESTARDGYIVVKCEKCEKWRRLDFTRHVID